MITSRLHVCVGLVNGLWTACVCCSLKVIQPKRSLRVRRNHDFRVPWVRIEELYRKKRLWIQRQQCRISLLGTVGDPTVGPRHQNVRRTAAYIWVYDDQGLENWIGYPRINVGSCYAHTPARENISWQDVRSSITPNVSHIDTVALGTCNPTEPRPQRIILHKSVRILGVEHGIPR